VKFAADVRTLEAAVTRLEASEKQRLEMLRLQLWDHRGVVSNGHAKEILR
jgi:hypothetical protein